MFDVREMQIQVLQAVTHIQKLSGRAVPAISEETRPLRDLDGFDSLNAEEVCMALSEQLETQGVEFEVPLEVFEADDGRYATIQVITQRICLQLQAIEENYHD